MAGNATRSRDAATATGPGARTTVLVLDEAEHVVAVHGSGEGVAVVEELRGRLLSEFAPTPTTDAVGAMIRASRGLVRGRLALAGWPTPGLHCIVVPQARPAVGANRTSEVEPVPRDAHNAHVSTDLAVVHPASAVAVFQHTDPGKDAQQFTLESANDAFMALIGGDSADAGLYLDSLLPVGDATRSAIESAWCAGASLSLSHVCLTVPARPSCTVTVDIAAVPAGRHHILLLAPATADDPATVVGSSRPSATARPGRLALYDDLTGLPNRSLLRERLGNALQRARRQESVVAVAFVDLDDFKSVNDRLGHRVGDELLMAVAERLRSALRESDTAARLGGDEFALLYEGLADEGEVAPVVNRHAALLRRPYSLSGGVVRVTAGIGVVVADARHMTAAELLAEADAAMYEAKNRNNGGWAVFDETRHEHLVTTCAMGEDLRYAISSQRLRLHYQPVLDAADRTLVECEALLRWRHRELKLLSPGHFLEAAERAHLMDALGAWTLYEAVRELGRWRVHVGARQLSLALNVSPSQLGNAAVPQLLDGALAQVPVDPQTLHVDLRTRTLSTLSRRAASDLRALTARGVALGVDDFGAAPISLTDLARHRVSYVRLDRTIVHGLRDDRGASVAAALIDLAHRVGLCVTAQGVQSTIEAETLRSLGCDRLQGYAFGRPRPGSGIETMLQANA